MNEWIKCEDQLPDAETTVMTFQASSCEPIWPAYYDGEEEGWKDLSGCPLGPGVTHWMPFPDPPEGQA